jgi:hypothetical protein
MPGSCSSNTPNGCAGCGPIFYLFYLDASTSQSKVGFLHEDIYYAQFNRNLNLNALFNNLYPEDDCIGDPTRSGDTGSLKSTGTYNYEVDEFGNIAIYVTGSTNTTRYAWIEWFCLYLPCNILERYPLEATTNSITVSAKTRCNPTATKTTVDCTKYDPEFISGDQECIGVGNCFMPNQEAPCGAFYRCKDDQKYTSPKNLQFFYGLAQSSASKKADILKDNKPQNCAGTTCGEGKDACWALYTGPYFFITDNNLDDPNANSTTAQKLKFKVATIKEGFDKTYKSVSGKVKFYYGGTDGKTPCCNDDFDGTVVKEGGYSISAGSTFKDYLLASDGVDLDNSDQSAVGQNIYVCTTIDNISFF